MTREKNRSSNLAGVGILRMTDAEEVAIEREYEQTEGVLPLATNYLRRKLAEDGFEPFEREFDADRTVTVYCEKDRKQTAVECLEMMVDRVLREFAKRPAGRWIVDARAAKTFDLTTVVWRFELYAGVRLYVDVRPGLPVRIVE